MARPSSVALGLLAAGVLAMGASLLEVVLADHVRDSGLQQTQALTRQLGLTDPALMT